MLAHGFRLHQANVTCWPMNFVYDRPMHHAGPRTTSTSDPWQMPVHELCLHPRVSNSHANGPVLAHGLCHPPLLMQCFCTGIVWVAAHGVLPPHKLRGRLGRENLQPQGVQVCLLNRWVVRKSYHYSCGSAGRWKNRMPIPKRWALSVSHSEVGQTRMINVPNEMQRN